MEEKLKLTALFKLGITVPILAHYCQCGESSIQNYLKGRSLPSGTKQLLIQEGLRKLLSDIKQIIEE